MEIISKEKFKELNKAMGKPENNQVFQENELNQLLRTRLHENKDIFTDEEIDQTVNNLDMFSKIYQLGIADCANVLKKEEVK